MDSSCATFSASNSEIRLQLVLIILMSQHTSSHLSLFLNNLNLDNIPPIWGSRVDPDLWACRTDINAGRWRKRYSLSTISAMKLSSTSGKIFPTSLVPWSSVCRLQPILSMDCTGGFDGAEVLLTVICRLKKLSKSKCGTPARYGTIPFCSYARTRLYPNSSRRKAHKHTGNYSAALNTQL